MLRSTGMLTGSCWSGSTAAAAARGGVSELKRAAGAWIAAADADTPPIWRTITIRSGGGIRPGPHRDVGDRAVGGDRSGARIVVVDGAVDPGLKPGAVGGARPRAIVAVERLRGERRLRLAAEAANPEPRRADSRASGSERRRPLPESERCERAQSEHGDDLGCADPAAHWRRGYLGCDQTRP